ncbi:MAG: ADOP family duplicated permease [Candidatus Acidiferrales bacterium]
MSWLKRVSHFLRALFRKEAAGRDMREEFQFHVEELIREYVAAGMNQEEARRQAMLEFGGHSQIREECRDARGGRWLEDFLQDVRYGVRLLRRNAGFTAVAVLTLALGIGANTAIFSVVDAVLLRPLPVRDPARVVIVQDSLPKINLLHTQVSALEFLDYKTHQDVFESSAAISSRNFNWTGVGTPQRVLALRVTSEFFPMLGIQPAIGRVFTVAEDNPGGPHVVLLSRGLWQREFGANRGVLGRTLSLDGGSYEVIGVLPSAFEVLYPHIDIVVPAAFSKNELTPEHRWSLAWTMLARLRHGESAVQAQAAMVPEAEHQAPDGGGALGGFRIDVRPFSDVRVGDVRRPLWMLLGAVALVLLIACVNIANLMLARAGARSKEMALRTALGAGPVRILRQVLTESFLLATGGGALGLLLAQWGIRALLGLAPENLVVSGTVGLNGSVLAFTLGVSLLAGIVFGIAPALRAARADCAETLKGSGQFGSSQSASQGMRRALVASEVALALVLLVCSGLLLRSFAKLLDVNPGFEPKNLLTLQIQLPNSKSNLANVSVFSETLLQRVAAIPGVLHAAMAFQPPFISGDNSVFTIRDYTPGPGRPEPHSDYLYVSPDYLATMGIPLLRGRWFTPQNFVAMKSGGFFGPGTAVVIDEALAKRFWPNRDPLGAEISWSDKGPWSAVVGVVGTVHGEDLATQSQGAIYFPRYSPFTTLVTRMARDPGSFAAAIREQVNKVDPDQPAYDVQTMEERISASLARRRFTATLLGLFAALALALALIGLQGVVAYLVSQQTHEIGVRMALGAQPGDIFKHVLAQGIAPALGGVAFGILGAVFASRLLADQLFNVTATDPETYLAVATLLVAAAAVAAYLPARRATKVDPMTALRYE